MPPDFYAAVVEPCWNQARLEPTAPAMDAFLGRPTFAELRAKLESLHPKIETSSGSYYLRSEREAAPAGSPEYRVVKSTETCV